MGIINNETFKVFDWHKAARLIREQSPIVAEAGLAEDWRWTGGTIWEAGKPVEITTTYVYLASTWATPVLYLDGVEIPCWKRQCDTPDWHAKTFWPDSALQILQNKEEK